MVPVESAPAVDITTPALASRWRASADHVSQYHRHARALDRLAARARRLDRAAGRWRRWGVGTARARRLDRQAQRLDVERLTREMEAEAEYRATLFRVGNTGTSTWRRLRRALLALGDATVWDIVASGEGEHEKSSADTQMVRRPSRVALGRLDTLRPDLDAPRLGNANGPDVWIYPEVVALGDDADRQPALIDLRETRLDARALRYVEADPLPENAHRVETTHRYVNADGGPDRRFSENPELPVALYGWLRFTSPTGLDEAFLVSDAPAALAVGDAWAAHRAALP